MDSSVDWGSSSGGDDMARNAHTTEEKRDHTKQHTDRRIIPEDAGPAWPYSVGRCGVHTGPAHVLFQYPLWAS